MGEIRFAGSLSFAILTQHHSSLIIKSHYSTLFVDQSLFVVRIFFVCFLSLPLIPAELAQTPGPSRVFYFCSRSAAPTPKILLSIGRG
jgi:hypothetical protein